MKNLTQNRRISINTDAKRCALEFFKLRFPDKVGADNRVNDPVYFEEWVHRFAGGSAYIFGDYESRRAVIDMAESGLVTII